MATEPAYVDQSALYSKVDTISTGKDDERNVAPAIRGSRSFFIIDKSKMIMETDTVEGAKVVYIPENEFEKVSIDTYSGMHVDVHHMTIIRACSRAYGVFCKQTVYICIVGHQSHEPYLCICIYSCASLYTIARHISFDTDP